jgi:hypothetical protein
MNSSWHHALEDAKTLSYVSFAIFHGDVAMFTHATACFQTSALNLSPELKKLLAAAVLCLFRSAASFDATRDIAVKALSLLVLHGSAQVFIHGDMFCSFARRKCPRLNAILFASIPEDDRMQFVIKYVLWMGVVPEGIDEFLHESAQEFIVGDMFFSFAYLKNPRLNAIVFASIPKDDRMQFVIKYVLWMGVVPEGIDWAAEFTPDTAPQFLRCATEDAAPPLRTLESMTLVADLWERCGLPDLPEMSEQWRFPVEWWKSAEKRAAERAAEPPAVTLLRYYGEYFAYVYKGTHPNQCRCVKAFPMEAFVAVTARKAERLAVCVASTATAEQRAALDDLLASEDETTEIAIRCALRHVVANTEIPAVATLLSSYLGVDSEETPKRVCHV